MTTEDNSQYDDSQYGDEPSPAVRQADAGAQAWRAVVHAQQVATPDHADFYSLAGHLVDTFAAVESLARVLRRQVEAYPDRSPIGRRAYDDTRWTDPRSRLAEAAAHLGDMAAEARRAGDRANRFWSTIGHIGVEDAIPGPEVTW